MKRFIAALLLVLLSSPAVAQEVEGSEINALPAVTTPADTDMLPTDQVGADETRKITRAQIVAGVLALLQAHEAATGVHGITAYMETLLDDATAADARTTLELGTAATSNTGDFEAAGAVSTHSADTTSVHGITDTSVLVVDSDLGTAAALDVPAAGDAAVGEVVKGDDTRLTDSRTPSSHAHAGEDVTSGTVAGARLALMVGDSGAGGTQGAVPAPGAGDAAAGKFLKADGTWVAPSGGIGGSLGATDNAIVRTDGTGGATAQGSDILLPDNETIRLPSDGVIEWTSSTTPGSGTVDLRMSRHAAGFFKWTDPSGGSAHTGYVFLRPDTGGVQFYSSAALSLNSSGGEGTRFTTSGDGEGLEILKQGGSNQGEGALFRNSNGNTIAWTLSSVKVEASTAVAASPNVIAATESGTCYNNTGATALNVHELPPAAAGIRLCGCVTDSDGIEFGAVGDDTIRDGASVTGAAGTITSTTVGDCLQLTAMDSASWYVTSANPAAHGWTTSAP